MSEMFKNYPQPDNYIPDNRPKCIPEFGLDIMTGETASHSFDIPFNVEDEALNYYVIYKLGIDVILVKDKENLIVTEEDDGTSVITCGLSEEETKMFSSTILDTSVQLKFLFKDNSIAYTDIYSVNVVDALDYHSDVPPKPAPVIVGFGYTED